ncbi:LysR family transcriptional regulator [Ornithinimicrobium pratense]|uniref:LysR family transcriptional regulator n=1 Tax=Ornithinimicrobium pratense TaxID=2593973 RepID=A0A5J6V3F5_9MICO|nr:LysR family transcriptional regulator [Ornithinimicrobium pratense]QFG68187.1 LysR family transcriptional regulator [Ornithinimicrobium pratense]
MDVQRLRAFRSVVATGSVRAAAEALGYSSSAVSQQVSALQRAVGLPLLQHVGRGVEPTAAGVALAERIDGFLAEVGHLDDFVGSLRNGHSSTLNLGYVASLAATWLPTIVGSLTAEFPETAIHLRHADGFDAAARPRLDVQILIEPAGFVEPDGYRLVPVAREPYVVTLPPGHRLADAQEVALAELADEPWIDNELGNAWCRPIVADACAAAGFQPRYRLGVHDYAPALTLVGAGLGVSLMPGVAARAVPAGVSIHPVVQPTPVRAISALVLRSTSSTPVVQRTVELIHRAGGTPRP